jgi:predicted aldo/keto reductase-like oxidoreductase
VRGYLFLAFLLGSAEVKNLGITFFQGMIYFQIFHFKTGLSFMELSRIVIGAMRFKDRKSAIEIIRFAIDCGFNYIDTSPCYCYKSETENSEAWVGEAVNHPDYRDRVLVSTKCSAGDGGLGLGPFNPQGGFGVRSREEFRQVFNQSLTRMNLPAVDYYHLWTTHTTEQFDAAMKAGSWYDGLMAQKDKWKHMGITTHGDAKTISSFLESGKFATVTLPLNVINATRVEVVDYCATKGIRVIAMNPLAGGFLAAHARLKELALRYLLTFPNVHILIGFSTVDEVKYAKKTLDTASDYRRTREQIIAEVDGLINATEPRCTACGYCAPCPQSINLGACLSYYNIYHYMHLAQAKKSFLQNQWNDTLKLDRCSACGLCEKRCPNQLPLKKIIAEARQLLYSA